jgi:hypothetical protein
VSIIDLRILRNCSCSRDTDDDWLFNVYLRYVGVQPEFVEMPGHLYAPLY